MKRVSAIALMLFLGLSTLANAAGPVTRGSLRILQRLKDTHWALQVTSVAGGQ